VEVPTGFEFEMDPNDRRRLTKLHRAITRDADRNRIIAELAMWEVQAGETVLLLSNRKDHCRRLGKLLTAMGVDARVVVGTTKKSERSGALDDLRSGAAPLVIATSLADEGLNIERLSRIILAFPERAHGKTVQRVGRLTRKWGGKDPVLFDIVDRNVETLARRAAERRRAYRSIGMNV
jgi:superfamily II DNA or RNA helicase